MPAAIVVFLVGILCIGFGISNMRGNISSLHSYHRHRVSEEDRIPMGKKVGLGMIIIGGTIVVFGVLMAVALLTDREIFTTVGTAIMIAGLVIGCAITMGAIIKYNKGLF